ncbi:hypothetical protein ACFLV7_13905 [Chloroflexota bacterium]
MEIISAASIYSMAFGNASPPQLAFFIVYRCCILRVESKEFLLNIAKKIRPELENMSGEEHRSSVFDVIGFLYSIPLAVVGLKWLMAPQADDITLRFLFGTKILRLIKERLLWSTLIKI